MIMTKCTNGHMFDASKHSACPACGAPAAGGGAEPIGATAPISPSMDAIGATAPLGATSGFGATGSVGATAPIGGSWGSENMKSTDFIGNNGFSNTDFSPNARGGVPTGYIPTGDYVSGGSKGGVERYDPTMGICVNEVAGFSPVVGWLVCIKGPDRGTDYRIHNGNNYIGRSPSMDICVMNDSHISNQNAGVLGYDDSEHLFFFGPAGGRNSVKVNGKMVINAVELSPYDILLLGKSEFIFVPLCGERFNWNEEA